MLLVKAPVTVPSDVWLLLIVGFEKVLQQTPLTVTDAPPSDVISPPLDALLEVIADTAVVVTVGDRIGSRTRRSTKTLPSISLPISSVRLMAVPNDSATDDRAVNAVSHPPSSRTLPDTPMTTSSS